MSGSASAKVELYNGSITEGDGYQVNNYVIDITDIFAEAETASFYVYNRDKLQEEFLLSVGDSHEFDFIDDGSIEVSLVSVSSGTLPVAKVSIVMSDYRLADIYENDVVDGGHEYATYSGTPVLEISKTVDANDIAVGETVRVTVTVENTGDDDAIDVVFSDPQQPKFILIDDILGSPGKIRVDVGDPPKKIYVYDLKATEAGTFSLNPTTASFTNSAGQSFPVASSNQPTVIVEGSDDLVSALLEVEMELDRYTVDRNDDIHGIINIRNAGDAPASAVSVSVVIPEGLEYNGGDSSIEVISGVPTIYLESFGVQQEKEFSFDVKAKEVGTYTLSLENSYLYNDGINSQMQSASSGLVTNKIYVVKGKYDYLFEQPFYVYLIPLIIIGAIAGWVYHRHKQYKF